MLYMFGSKYIRFKNIYFIFFYNVANLQHKNPLKTIVFEKKSKINVFKSDIFIPKHV